MGKLLEYGYEPLRSTGICTPETLQRYLRSMLTFRFGDDNREEVQLELTSLVAEKVAHSTLDQLDRDGGQVFEFPYLVHFCMHLL